MRGLIIDDDPTTRVLLQHLMEGLGVDVYLAENGQRGWEVLEAVDEISIILADWNMPCVNGIQFVKNLRGHEQYDDVVVIMVTSETDMEYVQEALEEGANEYVMKPVSREILLDKLEISGVDVSSAR